MDVVVEVVVNLMTRFIFQCNSTITVNTPGARRYTVLEYVNNKKNEDDWTAHDLVIIVIKYWATIMYYVRLYQMIRDECDSLL
jgi:hypothetical protein